MYGIPRTDIERAMNHYGITSEQYLSNPTLYPLPARGTGLITAANKLMDVQDAIHAELLAPAGLTEIRFYTPDQYSKTEMQDIFDSLYYKEVTIKKVTQGYDGIGGHYVAITYDNPAHIDAISILPTAVIPLVALGLISAVSGIAIFKAEEIGQNIAKLLLVFFGGAIALAALLRKPLEAYVAKR
jgi:hypothetical protein